ncbi:MAG: polysaccharide biosynthesis tyrosine autokinase [Alphaproteobacteria bacterium]|nr:polysaccharide biosynthesis tyrosine autokinase [Alphaproteobacteria bacterium]MDE2496160.1 polysaccharide biosynthesis tyrosine autokinase [Alphaproteobacteria bacterium]
MNHLTPMLNNRERSYGRRIPQINPTDQMMSEEDWISFAGLLRVVKIHWRTILAATCIAASLATLVTFLLVPLYTGSALVMVDERQNHVFSSDSDPSVLSDVPADPSSIASQVQVLQSRALVAQVVDKLKLVDDPEFTGTKHDIVSVISGALSQLMTVFQVGKYDARQLTAAQKRREAVISQVQGKLDVHSMGLSTVIEIDYRSASAVKAARIANAVADTYVDDQTEAKTNASESASKWLTSRVGQLTRQMASADAAVQQYKAENGLIDTSTGTPLTDQQLGDLTSQLVAAEGNEAEAEAKLARVKQLIHSGNSADVTEVVDSPLITQLREQEATLIQQKADLSSRYGPLHPKMQDIKAQIRDLDGKIREEVNRVAGTVSNEVSVAAARVGQLKHDMAQLSSSTNTQNQARVKLGQLEASASATHALYQSYLNRLMQTQQQASLDVPAVHVASAAPIPLAPTFPKKNLIIGASIPAGFLLGLLIALISDRMCNGFRSSSELETAIGLVALTTVPDIDSSSRSLREMAMQTVSHPQSQFSEAIRGLEIDLNPSEEEMSVGKAILVTSALPGEGKTTMAVNLARCLSLAGYRTVIVDADMRRPRVAAALGLQMVRHSLKDYLLKRCTLEDVLIPDPHSPLVAVVAVHAGDAAHHIGSPSMSAAIDRLRNIADFVVIDSPPVLAVHDAKLLSKMSDGVYFVVRWEKTPRDAVALAVKSLRAFGAKLLGAVLVRADAKQYQYYAYGYTGVPALLTYYDR